MTRPDPTAGGLQGAQPVGEPGGSKRPWWLLALLAVIAVIVLLLLLSRCGGDDDAVEGAADVTTSETAPDPTEDTATTEPTDTATPTPTTPDTESSTARAPGATTDAPLVSGDTALIPLVDPVDADALGALVGQPAEADALPVQSVPADEGFWAGPSETQRVWVQITGGGESPANVEAGDLITFTTGEVVANDTNFLEERNLTADQGAEQLAEQGIHITVPQGGFTLDP